MALAGSTILCNCHHVSTSKMLHHPTVKLHSRYTSSPWQAPVRVASLWDHPFSMLRVNVIIQHISFMPEDSSISSHVSLLCLLFILLHK
jgi:hypothetical protein